MKITEIRIQVGLSGPDLITLLTDLPEPIYPFRDTGMHLQIQTASGRGIEYVKNHFDGIETTVLNHLDIKPKWRKI